MLLIFEKIVNIEFDFETYNFLKINKIKYILSFFFIFFIIYILLNF